MTSVDLISAAAIWLFLSRSSRTASAVTIEVMCCLPIEEGDLGEQSTDLDVGDSPDELIASTDAAKSAPTFFDRAGGDDAGQKAIYFCLGNAMMTANGLNALELALIDPLLQRGVTDS